MQEVIVSNQKVVFVNVYLQRELFKTKVSNLVLSSTTKKNNIHSYKANPKTNNNKHKSE